jgi:membrane-associated HD superfamily phosphohydrolase
MDVENVSVTENWIAAGAALLGAVLCLSNGYTEWKHHDGPICTRRKILIFFRITVAVSALMGAFFEALGVFVLQAKSMYIAMAVISIVQSVISMAGTLSCKPRVVSNTH